MSELNLWLRRATRSLAKDSAAKVRAEILHHYEEARENAIHSGSAPEEAESIALQSLGDAKTVNCQYRRVLLTASEARLLGEGNWEATAVCARPWLKDLLIAIPAVAVLLAATTNNPTAARILLAAAIGTGTALAAPFLPIYTPARARIYRVAKWAAILASLVIALGPDGLKSSWLFSSSLWPLIWTEITRAAIRRKLPQNQWPKQLYL